MLKSQNSNFKTLVKNVNLSKRIIKIRFYIRFFMRCIGNRGKNKSTGKHLLSSDDTFPIYSECVRKQIHNEFQGLRIKDKIFKSENIYCQKNLIRQTSVLRIESKN